MKNFSGSQTSGMRNRARKLRAEGVHVVNFAAGELDQDTSAGIKAAARSPWFANIVCEIPAA